MRVSNSLPVEDWRQCGPVAARAEADGYGTVTVAELAHDPFIPVAMAALATSRIRLRTSVGLEQRTPVEWARNVRVPTFLYQVRDDSVTDPSDVQAMFDNIPVAEKKLQWIEGTTARFDGYLEFQRRPQPMLDWLAQHMS